MNNQKEGDVIHTNIDIGFGWRDRLKILLNGKAHMKVEVWSVEPVTVIKSESHIWTPPLFPKKMKIGYAEVAPTIAASSPEASSPRTTADSPVPSSGCAQEKEDPTSNTKQEHGN